MADLPRDVAEVNRLRENDVEASAVKLGAPEASATDGQDRSCESAGDPRRNSGSSSASPLDSGLEAGFHKVRCMYGWG